LRPDRVPCLRCEERRHLLRTTVDVVSDLQHQLAPLAGGHQLPEFKGPAGRAHGDLDISRRPSRHLSYDVAAVGRVLDGQEGSAGALTPLAVYEHELALDFGPLAEGSRARHNGIPFAATGTELDVPEPAVRRIGGPLDELGHS